MKLILKKAFTESDLKQETNQLLHPYPPEWCASKRRCSIHTSRAQEKAS